MNTNRSHVDIQIVGHLRSFAAHFAEPLEAKVPNSPV